MTTRFIELLDVDLPLNTWPETDIEAAVGAWWKKVNSTPWNPRIAAANFRLRLPQSEQDIRYARALADDVRLLRAINQRNRSEPHFRAEVIRQVVATLSFDPLAMMRIAPIVPEVETELTLLRSALGIPATSALEHVGVCDQELPRSPGVALTIAAMNGEYVDELGGTVAYEQWVIEVYAPRRVRLSLESHGGELSRKVLHRAEVDVAPLLDAFVERGLSATAQIDPTL